MQKQEQISRETLGEYIHSHQEDGEPYSDAIVPMLKGLTMTNNWMMPEKTNHLVLLFKDWIECYKRQPESEHKTQRLEAFESAVKMLESLQW